MKIFSLLLSFFIWIPLWSQNVGIGTSSPHPSAALEISDTNRGLLIPRVDTADIISPAVGLLVYHLADNGFYQYNGSSWQILGTVTDQISDSDQDTRIEVENNTDEDLIRFYTKGTEVMRQNGSTLEMLNNGKSVFIGENSGLQDDLTDNRNVYVGYHAGKNNQTGENNIAIGEQALRNGIIGSNNVAIGKQAMSLSTASNNVAIGLNSLQKNSTGTKNTAIGGYAGFTNITGNNNTHLGYEAGRGLSTSGSGNVMLGHQAGKDEEGSNKLYIANTDTDAPLIYGDFLQGELTINDELKVADYLVVGDLMGTKQETAEIAGAIQIGNAFSDNPAANDAGTIRWNAEADDYQGWDGGQWRSMTMPNEEIDVRIGIEIDTLPFTIDEPGYYYLTKNLNLAVSGSHGIFIASVHNVTINLNGFTISGPGNTGQSNHSGIYLAQARRVTIKNGTVQNWQKSGIYSSNISTRSTCIYEVFTMFNGIGVELYGYGCRITDCQSSFNLTHGYKLASHNRLESCHTQGNGGSGYIDAFYTNFINCTAYENAKDGFELESGNVLKFCRSSFNDNSGITGEDRNIITECDIYFNDYYGIFLDDYNTISNNVIVSNNQIKSVIYSGVEMNSSNYINNNNLSRNFLTGINTTGTYNLLDGNNVTYTLSFNGLANIGFNFDSAFNAWRNNTAAGNTFNNVSTTQPPSSRSNNNWLY